MDQEMEQEMEQEQTQEQEQEVTVYDPALKAQMESLQTQNQELQLMVKQMQAMLNEQFSRDGDTDKGGGDVDLAEQYINSPDSMTSRLLRSYGYKEEEIIGF